MRLLLDTHALLWWWDGSPRLPTRARRAIEDDAAQVHVSIASVWEIAIKVGKGKLSLSPLLQDDLRSGKALQPFIELPIHRAHALAAGLDKLPHQDPFDRLLIAQSRIENLTLVSNETTFDRFGIERLWA